MQRRRNGRQQRHQHYHEEEENDPVSKQPVMYNFIVFAHVCILRDIVAGSQDDAILLGESLLQEQTALATYSYQTRIPSH